MRSEVEILKTGIRARRARQLAVFAAAMGLTLSAVLWEAASTPLVAPARADVRPDIQRTSLTSPPVERAAPEPAQGGEPLPIREAHADGGYWYWFEQQQRSP
jgi:hypothetical protein